MVLGLPPFAQNIGTGTVQVEVIRCHLRSGAWRKRHQRRHGPHHARRNTTPGRSRKPALGRQDHARIARHVHAIAYSRPALRIRFVRHERSRGRPATDSPDGLAIDSSPFRPLVRCSLSPKRRLRPRAWTRILVPTAISRTVDSRRSTRAPRAKSAPRAGQGCSGHRLSDRGECTGLGLEDHLARAAAHPRRRREVNVPSLGRGAWLE